MTAKRFDFTLIRIRRRKHIHSVKKGIKHTKTTGKHKVRKERKKLTENPTGFDLVVASPNFW